MTYMVKDEGCGNVIGRCLDKRLISNAYKSHEE